jgi:hypothetical protein
MYNSTISCLNSFKDTLFFFLEHAGELRIFILRRRKAQNRQVQTAKGGNTDTGILHEA